MVIKQVRVTMFCIKYKVDGQEAEWCDPNIRGNRESMIYHEKINADRECEMLNCQYNNEGFIFFVADHKPTLN